jgi:putative MFS transporter
MFFDGFDIYLAANVLGALLKSGFSNLGQNAVFVSVTFVGMMFGSSLIGFLGDRYGRRFCYQVNLAVFGAGSVAAAFAPNIHVLIALRFIMGLGLGAENVAGYSTMTEFVPARQRGRWLALTAVLVVSGLPAAALVSLVLIPWFGWRSMFIVGGLGAIVVWYFRNRRLPESPRWLEAAGRLSEAEALLASIEREASGGAPLPIPAPPLAPVSRKLATLFEPPLLNRMIVGIVCLVVINTLIYGFVTWLPTFFVQEGMSIATSFGYALAMSFGAPIGSAIGAFTADHYGRKVTILSASACAILFGCTYPFVKDPILLPVVGFALMVPIYVLVALLFGVYVPELFPTEVRFRASGICNTFGRGATIITPFLVVSLFTRFGVQGVLILMIGLLAVQIVVVMALGIEPRNMRLEEMSGSDQLTVTRQ